MNAVNKTIKNRWLKGAVMLFMLSLCPIVTYGQKVDFSQKVMDEYIAMEKAADIDADKYKSAVEAMAVRLDSLATNPVRRSVVDAVVGYAYNKLAGSRQYYKDLESQAAFKMEAEKRIKNVLTDMDALADARGKYYKNVVMFGTDGNLFDHDMLYVLLENVSYSSLLTGKEKTDLYNKAAQLYKKKGNMNAYGLIMANMYKHRRLVSKDEGYIDDETYVEKMRALLEEVKAQEVGADVALEIKNAIYDRDEKILFLKWAVDNVGQSKSKKALENELLRCLCPKVSVSSYKTIVGDVPFNVTLNYWNVNKASIIVRKYKVEKKGLSNKGEVVRRYDINMGNDSVNQKRVAKGLPVEGYAEQTVSLPVGRYVVECIGANCKSSLGELCVSSMRMISFDGMNGHDVYVVDNKTGRPLPGVTIERKSDDGIRYDSIGTTDKNGLFRYTAEKNNRYVYVRAKKSKDDFTSTDYLGSPRFGDISSDWDKKGSMRAFNSKKYYGNIMQDRSIYRPGQKACIGCVVYSMSGDNATVIAGDSLIVKVTSPRRKVLMDKRLVTDRWGNVSFDIDFPADAEVGDWKISVSYVGGVLNKNIRVEEYKRPTFDVTYAKEVKTVAVDGTSTRNGGFALGDSILLGGKAAMFNGVPVQGAKVSYIIECLPMSWIRYIGDWMRVASDVVATDDDGNFQIPVKLTDKYMQSIHSFVHFRVKANVTDVAGETHEKVWTTIVSKRAFAIDVKCDKFMDIAGKHSFVVDAYDLSNLPYAAHGEFTISKAGKDLLSGEFDTNTEVVVPNDIVKAGCSYNISVKVADEKGYNVYGYSAFSVYDSSIEVEDMDRVGVDESRRAESDDAPDDVLYSPQTTYAENGEIDLYFSTAETDAYVYCYVYSNDTVLDRHYFVTDGLMKHFKLKHKKEWGVGINVTMVYVRNGKAFINSQKFTLEEPNKKLDVSWSSFRDNLLPGQDEKWTLHIKDKNGKPVSGASVLATMYDASLDNILPYSWNFNVPFLRETPYTLPIVTSEVHFPYINCRGSVNLNDIDDRRLDHFNWKFFFMPMRLRGQALMGGKSSNVAIDEALQGRVSGLAVASKAMVQNRVMFERADEDVDEIDMAFIGDDAVSRKMEDKFNAVSLRKDFAESAFFAPALVSGEDGNVDVSFTVPDALTQWKFMALAHTENVDYGMITGEAVTKKPFMLRPNMPRFVRWGDKVVIASAVVNQSESRHAGKVRMRLINPETEEVVLTMMKNFTVDTNKTADVNFEFTVKEGWEGMNCEIIALGDMASDGEMNYLPILTSKMELVETVPFYITGEKGGAPVDKTIDLTKMFNSNSASATKRGMKIEYTDNPSWMCIEALESVKNPETNNAIGFATSVYSNSMLLNLTEAFPVIEKYESKEEITKRVETACAKLAELQSADGGWAWFKGMTSNYYITLSVCEMLAKLHDYEGEKTPQNVEKMLNSGLAYLDKVVLKDYEEMKKDKAKYYDNSVCRYLYSSSLAADRMVSRDVVKMRNEYMKMIEDDLEDLTIYGIANISCVLRSFNRVASADRFVDFLKKYVVEKPNQGRCFTTDRALYSWMDYRIPTQVAAMNAIYKKDKNDAMLNDMQLWLIAQKQVQKWDNEINTIGVADLLLKIAPAETFHISEKPVMSVDGVAIKQFDYGTNNHQRAEFDGKESQYVLQGNVIADVPKSVIDDGTKMLKVKKQSAGISWGAVYATSLEDISKVNAYATDELKVERKLYVQRPGSDEWVEFNISSSEYSKGKVALNIGDKVRVRTIVTADRDMDFVHVTVNVPACFEPVRQVSGYTWLGGRGGYLSNRDSHSDMYFDSFTRGTATLDTYYNIVRAGQYEFGVSSVCCEYANQFGGHTGSFVMKVAK
ncbi:MAG: MG2 domain-containing protein [Bacteroidaceae bacterium]|nr:MG2 domain-containing protein [Bacteroidaceae bacterium]